MTSSERRADAMSRRTARIVWGFPPSIPIVFEESGRDDERE